MSGNRAEKEETGMAGVPQMGRHPERVAGVDSKAAGGAADRGLAGLSPGKLVGNEGPDVPDEMVEMRVDGSQVLVGVFEDQAGAERAIDALQRGGYDPREVNVLNKSAREAEELVDQIAPTDSSESTAGGEPEAERMQGQVTADKATKANTGTAVGVVAGAAAGAAMGLAAMQIPGVGNLLQSFGPVVALAGGASLGAGVGFWGGSLVGIATPEEETTTYTDELGRGLWLVAVRTNRIDETLALLRDAGARNLEDVETHAH